MTVEWGEARWRAYGAAQPLPPRAVPLAEAGGTVLAEPLVALVDLPAFDHAAMDGYAVRGTPPWTVAGEVRAGDPGPPPLAPGCAAEIGTGAQVPPGTTAVLPYEHAQLTDSQPGCARLTGTVTAGQHIRRAAEECAAGEKLLAAGAAVTPTIVGLAAALGHDRLTVHPVPQLSALVTGDELLVSGLPGGGRIRDAIGPMLPGLVTWAGGALAGSTPVPDSASALTAALSRQRTHLVLVSGSSSSGPADHLGAALRSLGGTLLVDGVACRPGHPQTLAVLPGGRLVAGLPGNPLAGLVAFLTLALPVITALRGAELPEPAATTGPGMRRHPRDTRLVPVRVRDGVAEALPHAGSAMLRGAALADAIAVVPPGGEPVRLLPLPDGVRRWAG